MIKIVTTNFGIVETKPKIIFEHNNIKYAIVNYPYSKIEDEIFYTNRCVHFESGVLVPFFNRRTTIKDLIETSKTIMDNIKKDLGEKKFIEEINSKQKIN